MTALTHPVMLFAAGFGTRMAPLTDARPKPLIPVAGRALLDHALDMAIAAQPPRIVINTHYLADQIAHHTAGKPVTLSHEMDQILDTGGGLRHALPLLGDDTVFTMNTDAVWAGPNPLTQLAAAWNPDLMDALLLCVPPAQAVGHKGQGDFITPIASTNANASAAIRGPGLVYSGVQIIKTAGLASIPDAAFSLNLLWDQMIPPGRLHILPYCGHWCDVGHPAGIALAETMLDNHAPV